MATTLHSSSDYPLILRWRLPDRPLRPRPIRLPPSSRRRPPSLEAPPWLPTGPVSQPFDFCAHVRRLCTDVVAHCRELRHIDTRRLLFGVTQARTGRAHGLQARVTPLRFANGALTRRRRARTYQVQRYVVNGVEMLYLVTFCLPRFLDQAFEDKFVTLFHELYHISPHFEGDLRRHGGRYDLHTHSKRSYDRHMSQLANEYLANGADRGLHAFMRLNFAQLQHRHGSVVGVTVPRPRLIPLGEPKAPHEKPERGLEAAGASSQTARLIARRGPSALRCVSRLSETHARTGRTTLPDTSVNRNCRPW